MLKWAPVRTALAISVSVTQVALSGLASLGAGCSERGATFSEDFLYRPCSEDTRTGAFSLELKPADRGNQPYSQVAGGVRDGVDSRTVWAKESVNGGGAACQLVVGRPSACSTFCSSPQACMGTTCQNLPMSKSVGEITFSGLVIPVMMTPTITAAGAVVYSGLIPSDTAFPPYAVGDALGLVATGADYSGFRLSGRGITPLEVGAGQTLIVAEDQPLTIDWVAPSAGAGRVRLSMDLAHHGGVAAEIRCDDLPDTGSVTIPAPLINALISKGTAGFPSVSLTRVSVDSTTVGPGCVEFMVTSGVTLPLKVVGVESCTEDAACTPPEICRPAGAPNGLSCGLP